MDATTVTKKRGRKPKVIPVVEETKPVEIKSVPVVVEEQHNIEVIKPDVKEKSKSPDNKKSKRQDTGKMTYIKAFALWREKNNYSGLSPKRDSKEYQEIMTILREGQKQTEQK